jgi:signal transduction histidine kinase
MTAGITRQFYIYKKEKENMLIAYLEQQKQINQRILETQDEERRRISKELHDDFGAGLTLITMMSDSARQKNLLISEFNQIADTARKLANNLGEIIWSMNPETQNLQQVLYHLREELSNLLEYSEIQVEFQFPKHIPSIKLNNLQRRNLILICKESTNNAIKYSGGNHIYIKANLFHRILQFEILDNGSGFDLVNAKKGNGLKNIQKRIDDLKGSLKINATHQGTSVQFEFELDPENEF